MVKIRLKRTGAKDNACYRIVVADNRGPRDGGFIEEVGVYTPLIKKQECSLKLDRIDYWLGRGAQPTETVDSLVKYYRRAAKAKAESEAEQEADSEI